jgi:hypothetical protein
MIKHAVIDLNCSDGFLGHRHFFYTQKATYRITLLTPRFWRLKAKWFTSWSFWGLYLPAIAIEKEAIADD